jgi:integrase
MTDYLMQRKGVYYYRRRVPEYVAEFDARKFVRSSLGTKDRREALRKSIIHNDFIEEFWRSLVRHRGQATPETDYKLAVKRAKTFSLNYRSAVEISAAPIERIVNRIAFVSEDIESEGKVKTILGGVDKPKVLLKDCIEQYWVASADKILNKSDDQIRKWKNPRSAAFLHFTDVLGKDKLVQDLERADIIKFFHALRERITKLEIMAATANKSLGYVKDILCAIAIENEVDINFKSLFEELKFKEKNNTRQPFEASYVQNILLKSDALSGLNDEARMLVFAMSDTGARESELIGLRSQDIVLNSDIPFIWIQPYENHALKTPHSHRKIPLVGASLYAFKKLPLGFSRYRSADVASSAINKFLRENELKPSPSHTLYSLRHTFKDRLRDIQAPEEIIDELMGHKTRGPKYGRGHLLNKKQEWLDKIAFDLG